MVSAAGPHVKHRARQIWRLDINNARTFDMLRRPSVTARML